MHRGRWYRRILPPAWFMNFDDYWRPAVQWFPFFQFFYADRGLFVPHGTKMVPLAIEPKLGYIEWGCQFSQLGLDFATKMRFQLKADAPEHEVAVATIDNFGGLMDVHYFVRTPQILCSRNLWQFNVPPRDTFYFGDFSQFTGLALVPVSYHDEH